MQKLFGLILFLDFLLAYPLSFKGVQIDAEMRMDPAVEKAGVVSIYLDVRNDSKNYFWIEPHFSSYLQSERRRYYREVVDSPAKFKSGLLAPGENRTGFVYFKPEATKGLTYVIYGMKFDDSTPAFELRWNFDNPPTADIQNQTITNQSVIKPRLSYNDQLLIMRGEPGQLNLQALKTDIPERIGRGQRLPINVYLPTGIDAEEVTVVLGVSDSLRLTKGRDGVFFGNMSISELYSPGTYVLTILVRTVDRQTGTVQRDLKIY